MARPRSEETVLRQSKEMPAMAGAANTASKRSILGSNQSSMRERNERLALSLIRRRGPLAKSEIARLTGLSAQTVSVIMRALEADGLLVKRDPVRGKVGQPYVPMGLAEDGAYFLGLKIGRRRAELALINFLGRVLSRKSAVYRYPTPEATVAFALEAIDELAGGLSERLRDRIAGLGVAMPFFLWNWAQALGVPDERMASWREVDIGREIASHFSFPVFVENDATSACGAELVFGAQDMPRNFLYFFMGFFVGGGIVLNGALYTGPTGNAGAIGPVPVPGPDGEIRQLIDVASLWVLERELIEAGDDASPMWESADEWEFDSLVVNDWIEGAAAGLAHAILSACAVMDFEAVLIDGWMPESFRAELVVRTEAALSGMNLAGVAAPEIRPGTVGPDARALGAASLPLYERFLADQAPLRKAV